MANGTRQEGMLCGRRHCMGFRSPDTRTRTADQQLPGRDVYVSEGQLSADTGPKVTTVTLFTTDPFQARIHPKIAIADAILPLERTSKILGVLLDTSFAFHHHCENVAKIVSKRNNILKALAGTSWGQQIETLLVTYKAVGRSIANYTKLSEFPPAHTRCQALIISIVRHRC